MKTRIKIGLLSFFVVFCLSGFGFASTTSSTGSAFLMNISSQKAVVDSMYDTTYQSVYQLFQTQGLSVLKSLTYQALVCLGVMSDTALLQQLQTDIKTLKVNFATSYSTLYADAADIEQKHLIEQNANISLFASGVSYTSALSNLSGQFAALFAAQVQLASQFRQSYVSKIATFVKDVDDYSLKNKDLVGTVVSRLQKIQSLEQKSESVSSQLLALQLKLAGTGGRFFDKIQHLKEVSLSGLNLELSGLIALQVKRTPVLPMLAAELGTQQIYALGLFGLQFDERMNSFLAQWYDNKQYTQLQNQLVSLRKNYTSSAGNQCQNIATSSTFDADVLSVSSGLNTILSRIQSGSIISSSSGLTFQTRVLNLFTLVEKDKTASIATFKTVIQQKTSTLLNELRNQKNTLSGSVSTTGIVTAPISTAVGLYELPKGYTFTKPYSLNQKDAGVSILQKLLTNISLYTGDISGIYSKQTKAALLQFQWNNMLLKGYEKKPQTWGWMGPATRTALNQFFK